MITYVCSECPRSACVTSQENAPTPCFCPYTGMRNASWHVIGDAVAAENSTSPSADNSSRDELQYIVDQVSEWSMEECAVEQGYACPFREERIRGEMENGESETREEAEKLIDRTSSCGLRGEEGKCWVEYYRREFRVGKGGEL